MKLHTDPLSASAGIPADEAKKRAIAQALWTEIHWLMPTDRAVAITVDGDDIRVAFGPPGPGSCPASH